MDRIEQYQQIIIDIFNEYAQIPYRYGEIKKEIIVNREATRYLLLSIGWQKDQRIHSCMIHIDIIDGKLWIQNDNTEYGVATDLQRHGVPHNHIVLGFRQPDLRKYSGYAVE